MPPPAGVFATADEHLQDGDGIRRRETKKPRRFTLCNMNVDLAFLAVAVACIAIGVLLRAALLGTMRRTASIGAAQGHPASLKPAELAYLSHEGDMDHTMLVLVVDLVQKLVKARPSSELPEFEPYEKAIADNVWQFVQNAAEQKVGHLIPLRSLKDPIQWLVRIRAIKIFVGETLRTFLSEMIKDPLHIKRYFSWTGIVRFTLELSTSTARAAVREPLRTLLHQKGLIVSDRAKSRFAGWLAVLAVAVLVSFSLAAWRLQPSLNYGSIVLASVLGLVNALIIKIVLSLPALLPSFEEFERIGSELPRLDLRMSLVRGALRWITVLTVSWAIFFFLAVTTIEWIVNKAITWVPAPDVIPLLAAATCTGILVVQLLFDARRIAVHDEPSQAAMRAIRSYHQQVAATRPLTGLKQMLSDSNYDAGFSNILAIYGLETLWFLG